MAMQPSELYALELREFSAIYQGWLKLRSDNIKQRWEVARYQAAAIIMPWLKDSRSMAEVLPLPWDEKPVEDVGYDPTDMAIREERVRKLMEEVYGREVSESYY